MTDIEQKYSELQGLLSSAEKCAGELAGLLQREQKENKEFIELFIKGDKAKEAAAVADAVGRAENTLKTSLGSEMGKYALRNEYEALKAKRDRLRSPSVHLLALLKKAGAGNTEPLSKNVLQGDAAEEIAAYSRGLEKLSSFAGDPVAFKKSFALKKEKAPDNIKTAGEKAISAKDIKVGGTIAFGHYPQTKSGADNTPIEWRALEVKGSKALLISRYALDCKPYNTQYTNITWEKCTLRSWLNGEFYKKAFTSAEQALIQLTAIDNSKSQGKSDWSTSGGNNTQDKVFLLSYAEAGKYFTSDSARTCAPTDYAIAQGAWTHPSDKADGRAAGAWWLRSPGNYQSLAAYVYSDGSRSDSNVIGTDGVVRPALWLDINP